MIRRLLTRPKAVGRAQPRRYDIPLDKDSGTGFLLLLIALMTFLAILALSASMALGALSERWSSGLENKLTIEIPASGENQETRGPEEIEAIATRIVSLLGNHPHVTSAEALNKEDVLALVSPWLGENLNFADVPVPGLVKVEMKKTEEKIINGLSERIEAIDPVSRIDTHDAWLGDLIRFSSALQLAAFILAVVIGATTITAIAGAVRSRMAMHQAEVELLHLMGASDEYITGQFQRHAMLLAAKGGAIGTVLALASLALTGWAGGKADIQLVPDLSLSLVHIALLMTMPLVAAGIAALTARHTVFRTLSQMP